MVSPPMCGDRPEVTGDPRSRCAFTHDRGLPDAGVTAHQHDRRQPLAGVREGAFEDRQLRAPPDEVFHEQPVRWHATQYHPTC